ncbi:CXADR-like membrane protein isoform X1 [Latimeria chalumnae]|uniref:CXADR like membrane protein n=1 Tax=Latimeria chalumnae TaxID=7897 RepID=M3XJT0_LATCH|nr:PREDICTED: CXADR-like membrane protein isoform X1 [Latimeria chalumnae]|eukprot:XP_006011531.1 PREDICTED: CXADR-like membrane protein isoform X1 [Latimeria chalumnae]
MAAISAILLVSLSFWITDAQTEIKKVADQDVTLPCRHPFGTAGSDSLDIEWLLQHSESNQKVVISYSGGNVYDNLNTNLKGRVAFASDFLTGDASLGISSLQPADSGQYSCKVKSNGQYEWNHVILKVLVKPSKPKCWMDGKLIEGSDLTLQCKSADGTEPIAYKWERISDTEGKTIHLPPNSRIVDLSHPEVILLRNLTHEIAGLYQCTATNEAGEDNCFLQVTIQYVRGVGIVAGAVVGVVAGVFLLFLVVWLIFRRKEKKRYEEDERPNEIREDAEAPKAKLVKPNSSSSRSGSSRSGSSSTRSTGNSTSRSQRIRTPQQAQNGAPPAYKEVAMQKGETEENKISPANLVRMGATPVMVPAQSRAFQTV